MQNRKNLPFALFFLLISSVVLATPHLSRVILRIDQCADSHSLEIRLTNLQDDPTTITVYRSTGTLWFSDASSGQPDYRKTICLKEMPDGDYLISALHQGMQYTRAFRLEGDEVRVFKQPDGAAQEDRTVALDAGDGGSISNARVSVSGEKRLRLQVAYVPECGVAIQLSGPDGKPVHDDFVIAQPAIDREYSLKRYAPGWYILVLYVGDATLIQQIQVRKEDIVLEQQAFLGGAVTTVAR